MQILSLLSLPPTASTMTTALCFKTPLPLELCKRILPQACDEKDTATITSISTIRSPSRHVLFPSEAYAPISTCSTLDM